jgi:predicted transcriptional regulator
MEALLEIIKMLDNTTEIASETTSSFTFNVDDNLTYIVDQLADNSVTAKDANKLKKGLMVDALTELQSMERANVSLDMVKTSIFETNGWNYKEENAITGKQVIHNFGKGCTAPSVVSVMFSQAKSYENNGLRFVNAINWQKVVEGGKSIDKLADVKTQVKSLVKAASSIEENPTAIEQLVNTLKAITDGLETGNFLFEND